MAQYFGQVPTSLTPVAVPCNYRVLGFSPAIHSTDPRTYTLLADGIELASGGRIILDLSLVNKGLISVIDNAAAGDTDITLDDAVTAINEFLLKQAS